MLHVLQNIPKDFQCFRRLLGCSVRHARNMEEGLSPANFCEVYTGSGPSRSRRHELRAEFTF